MGNPLIPNAKSVSAMIKDVVINPVFSLNVQTKVVSHNGERRIEYGKSSQGNLLDFGTVDMSYAGIHSGNGQDFEVIPHREGSAHTEVFLEIKNNTYNNFEVNMTVSGTLIALRPPENSSKEGSSVMHVMDLLGPVYFHDNGHLNRYDPDDKNFRVKKAVPNGTPITLYKVEFFRPISDKFAAALFLDFLPLDIQSGSYNGLATWTITAL